MTIELDINTLADVLKAPVRRAIYQPWPIDPPEEIPAVPKSIQDLLYVAEQDPSLTTPDDKAKSIVQKIPTNLHANALGAFAAEVVKLRRQWRAAQETIEAQRDDVMERMSEIRHLDLANETATDVAARCGFSSADQLQKWLQARGENDLWKNLAGRDAELARERRERAADARRRKKRSEQLAAEAAAAAAAAQSVSTQAVEGEVVSNEPAHPDATVTPTEPTGPPPTKAPVHASRKVLAVSNSWADLMATEVAMPDGSLAVIENMTADQLTEVAHVLFDTSEQLHALAEALNTAGVATAADLPEGVAANVLT